MLAAFPDVEECVVLERDTDDRLDVLVTLRADADPAAAWEEAIGGVLEHAADVHVVTDAWLVRGPDSALDRAGTGRRLRDFRAGVWLPGFEPGPGLGGWPEPVPAERIRVPFTGPGSGHAALTWGQRDIWNTMVRQRNWLPQGGRRPLAPGTRAEDVAAELAYLHSRYQSMRTRLTVVEDEVRQYVATSGETVLELFDTSPGQNPDVLAAKVEATYRRRPYDLRTEWPIRMAVVRAEGACTHLVVLMHHLTLDAGGAATMLREVAVREHAEPTGMQPLEQAAWQASEAGKRHNAKTAQYFAQALGTLAGTTAGTSPVAPAALAGPRRPRHWAGRLVSPALTADVARISARTGADDSAVFTALLGLAFGHVTGAERVLFRPRVGNRFRPALADVVCFVAQSGLLVLDLAGATFDEVVARARRATMVAVKHAYFDPDTLARLGAPPGVPVFLNDRRSAASGGYTSETAPGAIPRSHTSTFTWLYRRAEPTEPLSVTLDDLDGTLALSFHFDTHVIAPELVERMAWGVERIAHQARIAASPTANAP